MRTKLLISSAVAALTLGAAVSANAQTAAAANFDWTGPYVGINLGDDFDGATRFDRTTGSAANNNTAINLGLRPAGHATHTGGFTGGMQVGYNWQLHNNFGFSSFGWNGGWVLGAEADAEYTDIRRTDTLSNTTLYGPLDTLGATPTTRLNQYQGDLAFLGTVRGRLGYAMGPAFLYGTGGFAYGDVTRRTTFYGPNAPTTPYFSGTSNGMRTGYVYGGGIEYAVAPDSMFAWVNPFHSSGVTIKAEYLHYDLGADTLNMPGVNGGATIGGYSERVRTDGDIARAGINYKF